MVVQKTSIQKTYEMYISFDSINVDFLGSNRQRRIGSKIYKKHKSSTNEKKID